MRVPIDGHFRLLDYTAYPEESFKAGRVVSVSALRENPDLMVSSIYAELLWGFGEEDAQNQAAQHMLAVLGVW